jgi:plastocyanin
MDESTVAAGTYTLTVDDQASIHNFHLTGDGVDVATDISGTGKETFTVTLKPGTYTYVCDPHSSQMHGTLTVT